MPTYHYRCSSCDQHLEIVQRMSDDPITTCSACGGEMVKVLKPIGIVLKGSGFYRTDSRSGSSGASKAPEKTPEKKADTGSSSSSSSTDTSSSSSAASA